MDRRNLALELRRWAVEEMGLPPQKVPSEEVLQRLFIGQCADIWKYVIRHVHSQRTVRNIEGNLMWYQQLQHSAAQRSVEEEGQQRRKQLYQEILGLRSELQHLQDQIHSAQTELAGQEADSEKSQDYRRRSLLLRAFSKKREEECETLRESNIQIQRRCQHLQDVTRAAQRELLFPTLDADSATATFPEPEIPRDVRDVCRMRVKFLRSLHDDSISGSLGTGGEELRSLAHQQWMSMAERVWSSFPPNHVVSCLEHLALETARSVTRLQSSLATEPAETSCSVSDTTGDTQGTRDALETSRCARSLGDSVRHDSPDVLPSFATLIQEGWAESVKVVSGLRLVQRQTRELSEQLAARIQEIHESQGDGSEMALLRRAAFDAELRLVLLHGSRDALLQECLALQAEATDRKQEVRHLQQQQHNIQESCALLDKTQTQIQVLIRGNSSSKARIGRSCAEVQKYVQDKLLVRPQEVSQGCKRLQDSIMKDVTHFSAISLPALQKVCADGVNQVPAQDLSINRLSNPHSSYYNLYRGIYSSAGLSLYKAPETALNHVADAKKQLRFLRAQLCSRSQAVTKIQRQICDTQNPDTDTLLNLLSAHYTQQIEHLMPRLQLLIEQCDKSLECGEEVQGSIRDWWEQSAQMCLPWEQRGGLTLRQWLDRWTVAVTALQRASGGRN